MNTDIFKKCLGFKLAGVLSANHHILLTARNLDSVNQAKCKIKTIVPNASITTQQLDVSRFDSIKVFHKWMISTNTTVDIIVNNVGVNDENQLENKAFDIMNTNLFGIINLTETITHLRWKNYFNIFYAWQIKIITTIYLKIIIRENDKIINITNGQRSHTQLKRRQLQNMVFAYSTTLQSIQSINQCLCQICLNRFSITKSIYILCSSWMRVKTDMGGPKAPSEIKDGIFTSKFLIQELPYGRKSTISCQVFQ
ncbi:unnamed protein product [Paramecium sonneborni]|uniref:Uncharacterized protein n=1 Tax=Paramecium sonneborni TaxID=65129 RepID=A0A8S1M1B4_9CILI|nr:unnamed protein product [Paramecium sonneborni]